MCKCEHVIDGNSIQFCFSSNESLYQRLADLQKENAELKAKLEEKQIPPTGTRVRSKKHGRVGYSLGSLDPAGWLNVSSNNNLNADWLFAEWEEIEIKVKECVTKL